MLGNLKVYLAGACRDVDDEGAGWREEATKKLNKVAEWVNAQIVVINPVKYFTYANNSGNSSKQIKAYYMSRLRDCDLILVNLKGTATSVGTGQECQFAVDNHIPIIGFNDDNSYPWIAEVDADVVFSNLNLAIDYIRDYYLV